MRRTESNNENLTSSIEQVKSVLKDIDHSIEEWVQFIIDQIEESRQG